MEFQLVSRARKCANLEVYEKEITANYTSRRPRYLIVTLYRGNRARAPAGASENPARERVLSSSHFPPLFSFEPPPGCDTPVPVLIITRLISFRAAARSRTSAFLPAVRRKVPPPASCFSFPYLARPAAGLATRGLTCATSLIKLFIYEHVPGPPVVHGAKLSNRAV